MSLPTPAHKVAKLQTLLQTKAKAEPAFRFYALWDKIYRQDVLRKPYRALSPERRSTGSGWRTFEQIETHGLEQWLEILEQELRTKRYRPQPLLRVWISKSNGGQRPLGIPTIRDRVVQMAVVLIIGPIFEADLLPQQYGFRPGVDAKMAVRLIFRHATQHGRREVVDADLRDYFTSIPHTPLLRSLRRRIANGQLLHIIKSWLTVPVMEYIDGRPVRTTEARRTKRGTPQGGVISPLLANCYFRRFLLAWHQHGHQAQLDAHVVNYADDFVICCKLRNGQAALTRMKALMTRLGLTLNEARTRIACLLEESFNFLGYTFGRFYNKEGRPYIGTRRSRKAIKSLLARIHERTSPHWYADTPENTATVISRLVRGWCGYLYQGPVMQVYALVRKYTERRVRRWLMRRTGRRGTGYRQYTDEYLYQTLGLYAVPLRRADLSSTKV